MPTPPNHTAPAPPSPGLLLFKSIYEAAFRVLVAAAAHIPTTSLSFNLILKHGYTIAHCFLRLASIRLTIEKSPGRITPRELSRLAEAARFIKVLLGSPIDFSPWTTLSPAELTPPPHHSPTPQSAVEKSAFRNPLSVRTVPCRVLLAPGAALASLCNTIATLKALLGVTLPDPNSPSPWSTPSTPSTPTWKSLLADSARLMKMLSAMPSPPRSARRASSPPRSALHDSSSPAPRPPPPRR